MRLTIASPVSACLVMLALPAALPLDPAIARAQSPEVQAVQAVHDTQAAATRLVGEWVLDTTRTTRGPGAPAQLRMHVRRDGGGLVVRRVAETPAGTMAVTFAYALDGAPSVNRTRQGGVDIVITTRVRGNGAVLTLDSAIQAPGETIQQVDAWTIAPAGQELSIARTIRVGEQQGALAMVFRRQMG
jgi:hypothetical protein